MIEIANQVRIIMRLLKKRKGYLRTGMRKDTAELEDLIETEAIYLDFENKLKELESNDIL
jgi:hypothetical protein